MAQIQIKFLIISQSFPLTKLQELDLQKTLSK